MRADANRALSRNACVTAKVYFSCTASLGNWLKSHIPSSAAAGTRATGWGDSLWTLSVFDTGGANPTTDLALNQTATASSADNSSDGAGNAVDGNPNTRWSSAYEDDQWIQVDLGSTQSFDQVYLLWEQAYAETFSVQVVVENDRARFDLETRVIEHQPPVRASGLGRVTALKIEILRCAEQRRQGAETERGDVDEIEDQTILLPGMEARAHNCAHSRNAAEPNSVRWKLEIWWDFRGLQTPVALDGTHWTMAGGAARASARTCSTAWA